jgi:hypothetical protein
MKTIQKLLWARGRNSRRVIHQQLELPLPGSRLTRDEIGFLAELRRIRGQLGGSAGRG